MQKKNEAHFKDKVRDRLKSLGPECYFFIKEAKALRGLADIFICYKGHFIAWELKKSFSEANRDRDGHALQKYHLFCVNRAGGLGRFVYPENFEECWNELVAQTSK
jgi:hypothetical protein